VSDGPAAVADEHFLTAFHGKERDEEKAEVVVDALEARLRQPAGRAQTRCIVHRDRARLDAADEEEHGFSG
jgi:hypothetical protein